MIENEDEKKKFRENKKSKLNIEGDLKLLNKVDFQSECMCCALNKNKQLLAVGLSNGCIKVYCMVSESVVYSLSEHSTLLPVTSLRWFNDSMYELIATYASGECKKWHVTNSTCVHAYIDDEQDLLACDISPSGKHFVCAGSEGIINVYDNIQAKQVASLRPSTNCEVMDGHMMRVFVLKYHPQDDRIFVSGGWDNTVQWWDTRTNRSIKRISGPHICGEAVDIEASSLKIVAASWRKERNLQVYDFASGKLVKDIKTERSKSMLYCAKWRDRNTLIAGGSNRNLLTYFNFTTEKVIGEVGNFGTAVVGLDVDRSLRYSIVAVCSERSVYIVQDSIKPVF